MNNNFERSADYFIQRLAELLLAQAGKEGVLEGNDQMMVKDKHGNNIIL